MPARIVFLEYSMKDCLRCIFIILSVVIFSLGTTGCATVPKEVVELSYVIGQDIDAIHASHRELIRKHFEALRVQTTIFLETRWVPAYLAGFIKNGELVTMAKDPDPVKAYEGVSAWVEVAVEEIEKKKKELLSPIDRDEKALLATVDESFARLSKANTTITAHLNSIRKVQEVQNEALKSLKLADLRGEINKRLIEASERAETALTKVEGVKFKVEELNEKKKELLQKNRKGGANR